MLCRLQMFIKTTFPTKLTPFNNGNYLTIQHLKLNPNEHIN